MQDDAYAEEEALVKEPSPVAVAVAAAVAAATCAEATEIDPEAARARQKLMVSTFGHVLRSKVLSCQHNVVSHSISTCAPHAQRIGFWQIACLMPSHAQMGDESAVSRVVQPAVI